MIVEKINGSIIKDDEYNYDFDIALFDRNNDDFLESVGEYVISTNTLTLDWDLINNLVNN